MKETRFIEQNKEKWAEYETLLGQSAPDPEKIYQLFYSISDDLAFARTHYPNRSVRLYLNNLVRNLFRNVYAGRRLSWKSVADFWKSDLPLALYQTRFEQYFALAVFFVAALVGVVSCLSDPGFAKGILGEGYVRMTIENIKNGHPMGVYEEQNPFSMFLKIAGNNLMVCFLGFVSGIGAGTFTLVFLLRNAIMVGTFQFFFHQYNLLWDTFLTIWMHGAIEISCLVIGAGAGFTIAKGLLFPGTFTRIQSLLLASRRAITIMMGLFPLIVLAAFIESYLTRYYFLPWPIRLSLILASLGFMIFYFWWYPVRVGKRLNETVAQADGLRFAPAEPFSTTRIYSAGEIFGHAIRIFAGILGESFWWVALLSILYVYGNDILIRQNLSFFEGSETRNADQVFQFLYRPPATALNLVCWLVLGWRTIRHLYPALLGKEKAGSVSRSAGLIPLTLFCLMVSGLLLLPFSWSFLYLFLLPFLFVWLGLSLHNSGKPASPIQAWNISMAQFGKVSATIGIYLILGGLLLSLTTSNLLTNAMELIYMNLPDPEDGIHQFLYREFPALLGYACTLMVFQLLCCASLILAFTLKETEEAKGLLNRIKTAFPQ